MLLIENKNVDILFRPSSAWFLLDGRKWLVIKMKSSFVRFMANEKKVHASNSFVSLGLEMDGILVGATLGSGETHFGPALLEALNFV